MIVLRPDDIVSNVKTTIDIADGLLDEARRAAAQEGTTLQALVEEGLRAVLKRTRRRAPFRLRKATFCGQGLQDNYIDGGCERIRDEVYQERGG